MPECVAGLARPASIEPATAAVSAQIMIAHMMVSSAFLFNGLMLFLSGMAARKTPLTYRSVPTALTCGSKVARRSTGRRYTLLPLSILQ